VVLGKQSVAEAGKNFWIMPLGKKVV